MRVKAIYNKMCTTLEMDDDDEGDAFLELELLGRRLVDETRPSTFNIAQQLLSKSDAQNTRDGRSRARCPLRKQPQTLKQQHQRRPLRQLQRTWAQRSQTGWLVCDKYSDLNTHDEVDAQRAVTVADDLELLDR